MSFYATLKEKKLPRYEHLYVMWSLEDLRFRAKVGISQDGHTRRNDVQASVSAITGKNISLWCFRLPVLLPKKNEAIAHRILRRFQYDGLRGSTGYSEWFYCFNVIAFLLAWWALAACGVPEPMWKAGYIILIPIPIDFMLIVTILAFFQYALIVLGFCVLYNSFPYLVKIMSWAIM